MFVSIIVSSRSGTLLRGSRLSSGLVSRLNRQHEILGLLSSSTGEGSDLGGALEKAGANRAEVTKSLIKLVRHGKYAQVAAAHADLQSAVSNETELSPLLGDGALQAIMQSYAFLQKPTQVRSVMSHIRDKQRYSSVAVSTLISAYCLSDKFSSAEQLLSAWITLWLKANDGDRAVDPQVSDFNTILAKSLSSEKEDTDGIVEEDIQPPSDLDGVNKLLMRIRSRTTTTEAGDSSSAEAQPRWLASILQHVDGQVLENTWPEPSVWASLARMYSLRHACDETLLILDICLSGVPTGLKVNLLTSDAKHTLSSICYNTIRVLCDSGRYHLAADVLARMREVHLYPNPTHLGLLFKYLHELDGLNSSLLLPFAESLQDLHAQNKITRSQFSALSSSLLSLFCKHSLVDQALTYILGAKGTRVLRATDVTSVIDNLVLHGNVKAAMELFCQMADAKSTLHSAIDRKFKPGIATALDASYHHVCRGLRREGNMHQLAQFTLIYGQSLQE